jgi:vacuolar-type H+-ATPase subunit I/STV1
MEEKRRLESVDQYRKQLDELQQLVDEQQVASQRLRAEHEEDKLNWNKQHQEHLLSVEVCNMGNMSSQFFKVLFTLTCYLKLKFSETLFHPCEGPRMRVG